MKDGCLTNASMCSTPAKQLLGTEWSLTAFGYLLASEEDCYYKLGNKREKSLLLKRTFHYIALNTSAAIFCKPDLLLSIERREFEFSYHYVS